MARCFCGCGRDVAFRRRPANRRGARVDEELRLVRALFDRGLRSPSAAALVRDGELLRMQLADAVHTGSGPSPETDREAREFIELAHERYGAGAFGKALKRSKLDPEHALALIARGEWDPFADAPPPAAPAAVLYEEKVPRPAAPPGAPDALGDLVGELERLARLHADGALTEEEYRLAKRRLLHDPGS